MADMQSRAKEEVIVTTLRLPRGLITEAKIRAIRAGHQTFNAYIVEVLKEATGANLGGHAPVAMKAHQNHSEASSHAAE